jgi:hypothetical protein
MGLRVVIISIPYGRIIIRKIQSKPAILKMEKSKIAALQITKNPT